MAKVLTTAREIRETLHAALDEALRDFALQMGAGVTWSAEVESDDEALTIVWRFQRREDA